MILDQFSDWMRANTKLSDNSIYKYLHAVKTISNDMLDASIICKPLCEMNLTEIDIAISQILIDPTFIRKNKRGNKMYSNSLKQYRYFFLDVADMSIDEPFIDCDLVDSDTAVQVTSAEKELIMQARIGQGMYRNNLLKKYGNRCVVTGIDNTKILIASHIKPWSVSDNRERIDIENGLLLSANMDRLFDSGLITFNDKGKLAVSSFLSKENRERLNISKTIFVDLRASDRLLRYLRFHQDVIFVK